MGPGCHLLTIVALNEVTPTNQSSSLNVCFIEPVEDLRAEVELRREQCPAHDLHVNVSMARGAPVLLHFLVSGTNRNFSEKYDMKHGGPQTFRISNAVPGDIARLVQRLHFSLSASILTLDFLSLFHVGTFDVVLRAANNFSVMETDAGNITVYCHNETVNQYDGDTVCD